MARGIRTHSRDKALINFRREQIAKCSSRIFVKKGYHKTSIREISRACQMSTGTLYHYIGSKEDILYLVFDYVFSRQIRYIENVSATYDTLAPTEALKKGIEDYFRGVDEVQDMIVFMYQETRSLRPSAMLNAFEQEKRIRDVFERILTRGEDCGEFRRLETIPIIANNIVALGDSWAHRRWLLRKYCTLEEYIEEQTKFIIQGVCK